MSKGFVFDPDAKTMTFHRGSGETTLTIPDSFPVLLLPDEVTIDDHDAVFPDVPKDRMFTHQWTITYTFDPGTGDHYSHSGVGRCIVTATPQEWSDTTTLVAAPSGADIFVGQIRLQRTVNPSHNWVGSAIVKMVPENVWLPLTGSVLLETQLGFARALSVYISGGNLVLHQQQSVSVAPGGFGAFGNGEPSSYSRFGSFPATGGETVYNSLAGYPVYYGGDASPQYKTQVYFDDTTVFGDPTVPQANRKTGSNPPSTTDPTDYGATWRIDIRGQFGRRS